MIRPSEIESHFWELCDDATYFEESGMEKYSNDTVSPDEAELDMRASEQAMVGIIELVETHPEHRSVFVRCFTDLVLWRRKSSL